MQGVFAGTTARLAGGIGIVGCAAVIALAAGGASVFGGLGSLFGTSGDSLRVARTEKAAADIVAAPPSAARTAATRRSAVTPTHTVRRRPRPSVPRRHSTAPSPSRPPAQGSPNPGQPPAPAPGLPSPPPPVPAPGGGQVVTTIAETVKGLGGQAPPQAAPITTPVTEVVDRLVQSCRGLPVCP